jgi:hypothetical protein
MDEYELGRQQQRGVKAQELLNSDILKEAFTYLNDEYLRAWRNTRVKDTEPREKLWQAIHIVQLVHDHLNKWAIDGRIATKDLASIKYLKR